MTLTQLKIERLFSRERLSTISPDRRWAGWKCLWNRDIHARLQQLVKRVASGERQSKPTQPRFKRHRSGTMLTAITAVLAGHPNGMRVCEIEVAVVAHLGGPVAESSIKSCLRTHTRSGSFEQLGYGRYRLRPE